MYADTVPIRIRRTSLRSLRHLKAMKMLTSERRVSDADAFDYAVRVAVRHEAQAGKKKKSKRLLDFAGFIKGGPRTNSAVDADEVIYGRDD